MSNMGHDFNPETFPSDEDNRLIPDFRNDLVNSIDGGEPLTDEQLQALQAGNVDPNEVHNALREIFNIDFPGTEAGA